MNVTFYELKQYAEESPIELAAGSTTTITCNYWRDITASGGSALVYKRDALGTLTDVTATVMPTGAVAYSDNQLTLKALTALASGYSYKIDVTATVGSDTALKSIIVRCSENKI